MNLNVDKALSAVALFATLALSACSVITSPAGPDLHESRAIPLDRSEQVRVGIKMPVGQLDVGGGSQQLVNADFTYNVPSWKPDVRYTTSGTTSDLVLEQPRAGSSSGNSKNQWDVRFHDGVPMDLKVEFGAGDARLNLGSLALNSLSVEMGAGTLRLDLRGSPKKDYWVRIRGGVGDATVYLPKDIGISATATGGIGDVKATGLRKSGDKYLNDAYDKPGPRINLDIQGGVGSISLIAD